MIGQDVSRRGFTMRDDQSNGDWVTLAKPWSELRPGLHDEVAAKTGEIHTYDGGQFVRVNGQCEVVARGDCHDADALR